TIFAPLPNKYVHKLKRNKIKYNIIASILILEIKVFILTQINITKQKNIQYFTYLYLCDEYPNKIANKVSNPL
ncbi:hypothetical protein, partial [Lacrimispora sp.]|uniref:hypothetical protein n=1 Tax=Lacrimispora sp. TaxID=2719234 RepID=UPI0028B1F1A8